MLFSFNSRGAGKIHRKTFIEFAKANLFQFPRRG